MAIVLGGGISGLSAGYYYFKKFCKPTAIFEASNRIGGWIRTEKHRDKGFLFEMGPRTLRPKGNAGANTLEMIEDLGIPVTAIKSTHPAARNRMIYAKGRLCLLPNSLGGIFKTVPPFSRPLVLSIWNDIKAGAQKSKYLDESIYDFVHRRFGKEIADYAISPMICGICAGDAKEISVRFLMNDIFENEQKYGGVLKGLFMSSMKLKKKRGLFASKDSFLYSEAKKEKWSMYSIEDGLETLPIRLGHYLKENNTEVHLSSECNEIYFGKKDVSLKFRQQEIKTKHVISSLPSYKLSPLLKNQHPGLAGKLLDIPYVDVAVVNLQYNGGDLLPQPAFGFLVPPLENKPILGVIFDSCCFDMIENTVLTVMLGGKWFREYFGLYPSQKDILDVALKEVRNILNIKEDPKITRVNILRKCIPQYNVGHKQNVIDIRRYINRYNLPISLCGSAYDGVGINDVILSARKSVEQIGAEV